MSSAPSSLPDALRAVLLDPAAATTVEVHGRTKAAVLVPLYEHEGALHAVFTRRRSDLRSHAGEISFPGGRRDKADADLLTTALREAEEEIGLPPDAVHVLGALAPTPTVATNFGVYPFVGLIEPGREWTCRRARSTRCSSCASATCAPRARAGACCTAGSRFAASSTTSARRRSSGARRRASSATCSRAVRPTSRRSQRVGTSAMSREDLLRSLRSHIKDERVLAAVAEVPRELFVSQSLEGFAYADRPLPIGAGRRSPSRRSSRACASCSS